MKVIYKYPIEVTAQGQSLRLPVGAKPLRVAKQESQVSLWVEQPWGEAVQDERRWFTVVGTGRCILADWQYVGTWEDPPLVWHLYEVIL